MHWLRVERRVQHFVDVLNQRDLQLATNVFRNKPVAVIGSSAGMFGGVWAQAELRKVLAAMGARVAEVEVAVGLAQDKLDADGRLLDEDVRAQLAEAVETLFSELLVAA